MNPVPRSRVSFIIPTLNAGGVLERCLSSIAAQDYPKECCEILVADGGSTDRTRAIAESFGARVVENPFRIAESGKRVALKSAQGEYIVFLDADNELSSPDFVALAVEALAAHPQALGVESYYPAARGMNSFCAYLTATLHISDPVSWLMSVKPIRLETEGEVERWTFPQHSLAYPLGANGFVFRKADLLAIGATDHFEDTHMAMQLAQRGQREWLRLAGRGVHHYVVDGVMDFLKKRRRQTYHFLTMRKNHGSWTAAKPRVSGAIACALCLTLVVPLVQTIWGLARSRDFRWLWHPLASLVSVLGVIWGLLTFLRVKPAPDSEAELQPIQGRK